MRRVKFIENLLRDVRFGLRTQRRSLAFTAVSILTLALGIGANTAIFSVVRAALLRPLPYADQERLITVGEVRSQQELSDTLNPVFWNASYPDYLDWRIQSKTFSSLAGFTGDGFTLRNGDQAEAVSAVQATTNFLATLGVKAFLGRDFHAGEDVSAGPYVGILTHRFWKSRFRGRSTRHRPFHPARL